MSGYDGIFGTLMVITLGAFLLFMGYILGEISVVKECESFGKFRTNADIYTCSKEQR